MVSKREFEYYLDEWHKLENISNNIHSSINTMDAMLDNIKSDIDARIKYYESNMPTIKSSASDHSKKLMKFKDKANLYYYNTRVEKTYEDLYKEISRLKNKYDVLTDSEITIPFKHDKSKRSKLIQKHHARIPPDILEKKKEDLVKRLEQVIDEYERMKVNRKLEPMSKVYVSHEGNIPIKGVKYLKDPMKEQRERINIQKYGAIHSHLAEIKEEGEYYDMNYVSLSDGSDFVYTLDKYIKMLDEKFESGKFRYRKSKKQPKRQLKQSASKQTFKGIKLDKHLNISNNLKKFKMPKIKL